MILFCETLLYVDIEKEYLVWKNNFLSSIINTLVGMITFGFIIILLGGTIGKIINDGIIIEIISISLAAIVCVIFFYKIEGNRDISLAITLTISLICSLLAVRITLILIVNQPEIIRIISIGASVFISFLAVLFLSMFIIMTVQDIYTELKNKPKKILAIKKEISNNIDIDSIKIVFMILINGSLGGVSGGFFGGTSFVIIGIMIGLALFGIGCYLYLIIKDYNYFKKLDKNLNRISRQTLANNLIEFETQKYRVKYLS